MTSTTPPPTDRPQGKNFAYAGPVRVVIDGDSYGYDEDNRELTVQYESDLGVCEIALELDSDHITITHRDPAFADGEVWEDSYGLRWVAQIDPEDPGTVRLYSAIGAINTTDEARPYGPWTRLLPAPGAPAEDDEHEPKTWVGPGGRIWDLTVKYYDRDGNLWHWAGGHQDVGGDLTPLFSRDDWTIQDVPVVFVHALSPLTPKGGA